MTIGRPTDFTQELADEICARLADGESLRSICSGDDFPDARTVYRWLNANEAFCQQYSRARELQADALFDEVLNIADDGRNDWMVRNCGDDERWVENGEALRRSQLRIDARKWMAGKLRPKKYGDLSKIELTGKDGAPIQTETKVDLSTFSADERAVLRLLAEKAATKRDGEKGEE